jgi:hypothetical protein
VRTRYLQAVVGISGQGVHLADDGEQHLFWVLQHQELQYKLPPMSFGKYMKRRKRKKGKMYQKKEHK